MPLDERRFKPKEGELQSEGELSSEKALEFLLGVSEMLMSAETLELAWEAAAEDPDHPLTAKSFIDLVHSRSPKSALETYQSWRLLCTDMSHVFFKALKEAYVPKIAEESGSEEEEE